LRLKIRLLKNVDSFSYQIVITGKVIDFAQQLCLYDQQLTFGIYRELPNKTYAKPEQCDVMSKLANHWNKV
jgi:hypothetical protein